MRIIIGGAGRVGLELGRALSSENKDVVLIDTNIKSIKAAQALDTLIVQGDVMRRSKLIEAGICDAKVFIAVTDSDERNMLACSLAKHTNSELSNSDSSLLTICRVSDPRFLEEQDAGDLSNWAGVDIAIHAINGAINRLHTGLKMTCFEEVIPFGHGAYIIAMEVTKDANNLVFSTLEEAGERIGGLPVFVGLKRIGEPSKIPNASTQIFPKDMVAVSAIGIDSFSRIVRIMGHDEPDFPDKPSIAIFGATLVGEMMARSYLADGCKITVIEPDLVRANALAGSDIGDNPNIEVINGELDDKELLYEIDLGAHDIALAALSNDHASIAAALMAKEVGVTRTGLIMNDSDLVRVVKKMGITFAVDKKRVAVDMILACIHEALPGPYGVLSSIPDVVGISIPVSEKNQGKSLGESYSPSGCNVAFIQRKEKDGEILTLQARSQKVLQEGDKLLLFLPPEKIDEVERRFLG